MQLQNGNSKIHMSTEFDEDILLLLLSPCAFIIKTYTDD